MKKYAFFIRFIYITAFIIGIIFFFRAPANIPIHFDKNNIPDLIKNRWFIFALPAGLVLIGESFLSSLDLKRINDHKYYQNDTGLYKWSYGIAMCLIFIIFVITMYAEINY